MKENKIPYKTYLDESEIPTKWYNVRADMKNKPAPLLNPATLKPMTAEELSPVFCDELIAQELNNTDAYIDIPEEIQDFSAPTSSRRRSIHPRRSTTSSRATTPAAATSSTPRSRRLTTPRSRVSRALPPRPAQVSGAPLSRWLAPTSDLTARSTW